MLTADGFIERFGAHEWSELTDRDGTGMPDRDVADTAIRDAEAEIADYIGGRYAVPIENPPHSLLFRAYDVLRYRLHDESPSEEVRQRYEDAIRWLKEVRAGRIDLDGVPPRNDRVGAGSGYAAPDRCIVYDDDLQERYNRGVL